MGFLRDDRLGNISINNYGSTIKIVRYGGRGDCDILITTVHPNGNKYEYLAKERYYSDFIKGSVKSPYDMSIRNLGYIGEGNYKAHIHKDIYEKFHIMVNSAAKTNHKVCEEWCCFQEFAHWYIDNTYYCEEELYMHRLNPYKKELSPENCVLIPAKLSRSISTYINTIQYKVKKQNKKFVASIYNHVCYEMFYYKSFETEKEAEEAFNREKYKIILNDIMNYKDTLPEDTLHKLIINIRV